MGKRSDGEYGHVGTHSLPLILTTSVKYGNLPAMYNCVKCVYICVTVFLMLRMVCKFVIVFLKMVSLDFKTSWKMFTQRGGVCISLEIISKMRLPSVQPL